MNALESLVPYKFYVFQDMYSASLENLEIVDRTFVFKDANNLAGQTIDDQ